MIRLGEDWLKIENIVATERLPIDLDLEKLPSDLSVTEISYEPEIYPGLLIKVGENKAHVIVYSNGRFIITGVRPEKELSKAYGKLLDALRIAGVSLNV